MCFYNYNKVAGKMLSKTSHSACHHHISHISLTNHVLKLNQSLSVTMDAYLADKKPTKKLKIENNIVENTNDANLL